MRLCSPRFDKLFTEYRKIKKQVDTTKKAPVYQIIYYLCDCPSGQDILMKVF